jgi:hypothetical protein
VGPAEALGRLLDHLAGVDAPAAQRRQRVAGAPLGQVEPGGGQHVVDQALELGQIARDLGQVAARRLGALFGELEHDPDAGERGAQFVRDVRQQLFFAANQRRDARGHVVEGAAELADLVAPRGVGARPQVALAEGAHDADEPLERRDDRAGEGPRDEREHEGAEGHGGEHELQADEAHALFEHGVGDDVARAVFAHRRRDAPDVVADDDLFAPDFGQLGVGGGRERRLARREEQPVLEVVERDVHQVAFGLAAHRLGVAARLLVELRHVLDRGRPVQLAEVGGQDELVEGDDGEEGPDEEDGRVPHEPPEQAPPAHRGAGAHAAHPPSSSASM